MGEGAKGGNKGTSIKFLGYRPLLPSSLLSCLTQFTSLTPPFHLLSSHFSCHPHFPLIVQFTKIYRPQQLHLSLLPSDFMLACLEGPGVFFLVYPGEALTSVFLFVFISLLICLLMMMHMLHFTLDLVTMKLFNSLTSITSETSVFP